jgi:23S rRNA (guanosine2251-2'-O)-methyltransferase
MTEGKTKSDIIFGIHPVLEAIKSKEKISKIYIKKKASNPLISEIIKLAGESDIQVSGVPIEKLNRLVRGSHQGVVAELQLVETYDLVELLEHELMYKETVCILMLDGITDTRNFGAIVRSAECFGVDCIVVPKKESASINGFTIKSSAGAIFKVKICKENLKDALFILKSYDYQVISVTEKTNMNIRELETKKKKVLIMGSEERGISPFLIKNSDEKVKIEIKGETQSFNVSVATGIALFSIS